MWWRGSQRKMTLSIYRMLIATRKQIHDTDTDAHTHTHTDRTIHTHSNTRTASAVLSTETSLIKVITDLVFYVSAFYFIISCFFLLYYHWICCCCCCSCCFLHVDSQLLQIKFEKLVFDFFACKSTIISVQVALKSILRQ